jgi:hypothetical protein
MSKETLRRQLIKIGLYYGKGERRNILHDTVQNVAFCARYLRQIEKVWGIAKNSVAATKSDWTIVEQRNDLLQEFAKITSSQIVSGWKMAV